LNTPGGAQDTRPEKALSGLEDRVAPILKGLYPDWQPSVEERAMLAHFAALMKFRRVRRPVVGPVVRRRDMRDPGVGADFVRAFA
jgi:hypothetical protein